VLELRVGRLLDETTHELVDLARALALQQPFRRLLVHPDHSGSFPPGDRTGLWTAGPPVSRGRGTAFVPRSPPRGPAWRSARLSRHCSTPRSRSPCCAPCPSPSAPPLPPWRS